LLSNQKQKNKKEKKKGIPNVMCITNDDVISNDITCNNVMKKKMLEEGKGGKKRK